MHLSWSLGVVVLTVVAQVLGASRPHLEPRRKKPLLISFPGQITLPTIADLRKANATNNNRTFLNLDDIQADIFVGMRKPKEVFYFYTITNAPAYKNALKQNISSLVTSTSLVLSDPALQPLAFLNLAYSSSGLKALGIKDDLKDTDFAGGQFSSAAKNLKDDITKWEPGYTTGKIHGVFIVASDNQADIDTLLKKVTDQFGSSIAEVTRVQGAARPGDQAGHEHFGFLDGISQPAIQGFAKSALPGQSIVPPGVIIIGRKGDSKAAKRPAWTLDGSFMVFRKLQQFVPEFNKFLVDNPVQNPQGTLTPEQGSELLGARMIGRWKSGAPTDLTPYVDKPELGSDPTKNNNFDFAKLGSNIDTDQSRCPFSAHIRKTRPRKDIELGLNVDHQIMRAGIPYGPEVTDEEKSTSKTIIDRGLCFVSYQTSIDAGFIEQQDDWANDKDFAPGKNVTVGLDPAIGQVGGSKDRPVGGLDPQNPDRTIMVPQVVTARGGEYFFMPSISALTKKIAL